MRSVPVTAPMLRVVARSLRPVALTAVASGALLGLVLLMPGEPAWFFVQFVVLVLATGPGFLLDDPAVEATQVAPRSRGRRLALGLGGAAVLVSVAWAALAWVLTVAAPGLPLATMTAEVVALSAVSVAAAAVLARRGDPSPGTNVATTLALVGMAELVAGPLGTLRDALGLESFPTAALWTALTAVAVVVATAAVRDVAASQVGLIAPRPRTARRSSPRATR